MLDTRIGGHGQAYGYTYEHRRSSSYGCDENDSDSDCEAQRNLRVSRFVGNVAEKVVQPFERATKKVVNPVLNLLFTPPKGKKGRQGRYEDANYGGHGKQHRSGERMQQHYSGYDDANYGGHGKQHHSGHEDASYGAHVMKHQDRLMVPQVQPQYGYMIPSHGSGSGSGRAVVTKSSEYSRVSNLSCGKHKGG